MSQCQLDLYWQLNKTALRRGLILLGIGCTGTTEEEVITTPDGVWMRATGARAWRGFKPLRCNF